METLDLIIGLAVFALVIASMIITCLFYLSRDRPTWDWRDLNEPAPSPGIGYLPHDNRECWDCTGGNGSLIALLPRWRARGERYAPGLTGKVKRTE